jgi:spermidine/putrescine transport system ATP-binding protein
LFKEEDHLPSDHSVKIKATILNRIFLGEHTEYLLNDDRVGEFLALVPRQNEYDERPFETNETVFVTWSRETGLVLRGE